MYNTLFQNLNEQNSLKNMVSLTEFVDEDAVSRLREKGYDAGYTVDSWKKEFPQIDPEYVLCSQGLLLPSSLYYYDKKHYICFRIKLGNIFTLRVNPNETNADCCARIIAKSMERYEKKNYNELLLPIASEESGGIVISILSDMLENEAPNPNLYSAFLTVYTLCSNGVSLISSKAWNNLRLCKDAAQMAETEKKLERFGEVFTVYRGEADKSTPYQKAGSWTVNINAAYYFASWRSTEGSCIYTGTVNKKDVIEYIKDSSEQEILVIPGTVQSVKRMYCVEWDLFTKVISSTMFDRKHRFPKNSFPQNLQESLNAVYDNKKGDHDKAHSARVALLANFIYRMDVLLPLSGKDKKTYMEAYHLLEDLMDAAVFHDAGRNNDAVNSEHGMDGYEKYLKTHRENKIIEFLTCYHCRLDNEAKEYFENTFPGKELIWKAFCILKDADALDRVRFGFGSEDYLDVTTLRIKMSKELVPIAHYLIKAKVE